MKRSSRPRPRIEREPITWNRKPNDRLDWKHLDFIRSLPCCACSKGAPSEPAHIRIDIPADGQKGGTGLKPGDRYTVPLCPECHRLDNQAQHAGERSFWARLDVDPHDLASRLWAISGDIEQGLRAVLRFRQTIALHQRRA